MTLRIFEGFDFFDADDLPFEGWPVIPEPNLDDLRLQLLALIRTRTMTGPTGPTGSYSVEEEHRMREGARRRLSDPEHEANARQVGGSHYRADYQHWDFVADGNLGYFEGQITKYVARWNRKNGVQDLEKAKHFLQKMRELHTQGRYAPPVNPPNGFMMQWFESDPAIGNIEKIIIADVSNWQNASWLDNAMINISTLIAIAKDENAKG